MNRNSSCPMTRSKEGSSDHHLPQPSPGARVLQAGVGGAHVSSEPAAAVAFSSKHSAYLLLRPVLGDLTWTPTAGPGRAGSEVPILLLGSPQQGGDSLGLPCSLLPLQACLDLTKGWRRVWRSPPPSWKVPAEGTRAARPTSAGCPGSSLHRPETQEQLGACLPLCHCCPSGAASGSGSPGGSLEASAPLSPMGLGLPSEEGPAAHGHSCPQAA